jgi:predicted NUDIX family NTP pyrophosphohydrolase
MAALTKTSRRSTLSAGILAYRKGARGLEVLLVHPGGPFWRKKDGGGGKRVIAFAGEGHFDSAALASNTFDIEWPPRSGRRQTFPQVDRAEWFDIELARPKMLSGQMELLDRLLAIAGESAGK